MSEMSERIAKVAQETARNMGSYFDDFVAAEIARAAIEEMRVLTPEMERAGLKALAAAGVGSPLPGWAAQDCMNAVIRAALAKEPASID